MVSDGAKNSSAPEARMICFFSALMRPMSRSSRTPSDTMAFAKTRWAWLAESPSAERTTFSRPSRVSSTRSPGVFASPSRISDRSSKPGDGNSSTSTSSRSSSGICDAGMVMMIVFFVNFSLRARLRSLRTTLSCPFQH